MAYFDDEEEDDVLEGTTGAQLMEDKGIVNRLQQYSASQRTEQTR